MNKEKIFSSSLIPATAGVPIPAGINRKPTARPARATQIDTVDVCAQLFRFCKECDEKYLQPRRIQCLFDVDSGAMHPAPLRLVRDIIETLLADIAGNGVCQNSAASLTVTLRRQHGVWILALTERHIASLRRTATVRRLSLVRHRAQLLGAACRVHETGEGFITALMFDCESVSTGWQASGSTLIH
jgi:hypothetical protein